MVGEDAVSVYTQLLMKFVDLLVKIGEENRRNKKPKQSKIRQGSLSKKDFNRLMRKGAQFRFVQIPKAGEAEIEKNFRELGGTYFKVDDPDNNNSLFAVPAAQYDMINSAVKQDLSRVMKETPSAVSVKDGASRISEEDMPLVADVMRRYDIPMFSFKGSDGAYTNIVPSEFEGQYQQAMNRAAEIKEKLDNIEIIPFEQTSPIGKPDFIAKIMEKEDSKILAQAVRSRGLDVKFVRYGDDTAVVYPKWQAGKIEKALAEYKESFDESGKYRLTVNDNSISIDKGTLLKGESDNEYFVRVPNTHGMDHLKLDKADVKEINDGKTLLTRIDPERRYPIFDAAGGFVAEREGRELLKLYDLRYRKINRETQIVEYGDRINRIELLNKEQNKLISIGIDSAENIKEHLIEQGVQPKTADMLLSGINDIISRDDRFENFRSVFNYTVEKHEIVYADVPNIGDYLAQTRLSELVIGKADCIGELPVENGSRCCIYDKVENKYTVLSTEDRTEMIQQLNEMGYSPMLAKQLADRAENGADPQDVEEHVEHFDSINAELENMAYAVNENNAVLIHDMGDSVRYMTIDKEMPAADIEAALYNDFGITDKISAAMVMKELSEKGITDKLPAEEIGNVTVTKLTSDMIGVSIKDLKQIDQPMIMPIDNIDHKRLRDVGVDERTIRSIEHSLRRSAEEFGKPDKLTNLKKFAEKTFRAVGETAEKVGDKVAETAANIADKLPKGADR